MDLPGGYRLLRELGHSPGTVWAHAVAPDGAGVAVTVYDLRELSVHRDVLLARLAHFTNGEAVVDSDEHRVWHVASHPAAPVPTGASWLHSVQEAIGLLERLAATGVAHGRIEPWSVVRAATGRLVLLGPEAEATNPLSDLRGVARRLIGDFDRLLSDSKTLTVEEYEELQPPAELDTLLHSVVEGREGAPATLGDFVGRLRGFAPAPEDPATMATIASIVSTDTMSGSIVTGELFDGYRIDGILGKGGMGVVYRAWDPRLERPLAIKMVLAEMLGTEGKVRFLREARAASRINHPNVVTVYAAGEVEDNPYMAMELVEGRELREVLKEDEVGWEQSIRWVIDLLGGLAPLHEQGILHRDIKPDNVLVTPEGQVKLVDFGLAKDASQESEKAGLMGTVFYMSPEQARSGEMGPGTDVFSMAVMLYEMLCGELPFRGKKLMEVLQRIQKDEAPTLDYDGLGLPPELRPVLDRAMLKDPAERYASAAEFREALVEIVGEDPAFTAAARRRWILGSVLAVILLTVGGVFLVSQLSGPQIDHDSAVQLNELGMESQARGFVDEARAKFRESLLEDPGYAVAWNNLGMLEAGEGHWAEADSLLLRATDSDPAYAAAWYNLGTVEEQIGRPDEAEQAYREAVAVDPAFGFAWNNLGYLLNEAGKLDAAREALATGLNKTAEDAESRPYLLRTSGRVALASEDRVAARDFFERARAGLPVSAHAELDSLIATLSD